MQQQKGSVCVCRVCMCVCVRGTGNRKQKQVKSQKLLHEYPFSALLTLLCAFNFYGYDDVAVNWFGVGEVACHAHCPHAVKS